MASSKYKVHGTDHFSLTSTQFWSFEKLESSFVFVTATAWHPLMHQLARIYWRMYGKFMLMAAIYSECNMSHLIWSEWSLIIQGVSAAALQTLMSAWMEYSVFSGATPDMRNGPKLQSYLSTTITLLRNIWKLRQLKMKSLNCSAKLIAWHINTICIKKQRNAFIIFIQYYTDDILKMFRRSISAMMADILCIERMCYLAVPNCRAIFLSSPTIHKKLVTPRERRLSSQPWHTPGKKWFSPPVKLFICFLGFQFVSSSCLIQSCYHCRAEGCSDM